MIIAIIVSSRVSPRLTLCAGARPHAGCTRNAAEDAVAECSRGLGPMCGRECGSLSERACRHPDAVCAEIPFIRFLDVLLPLGIGGLPMNCCAASRPSWSRFEAAPMGIDAGIQRVKRMKGNRHPAIGQPQPFVFVARSSVSPNPSSWKISLLNGSVAAGPARTIWRGRMKKADERFALRTDSADERCTACTPVGVHLYEWRANRI
ncbi:MAG: hypothetical protein ACE10E_08770 [Acidiferrobacterales bacterium]